MSDIKEPKNEELEKSSLGTRGPVEPEPHCASDYSCEPLCTGISSYCYYYDRCNHPRKRDKEEWELQ